MPTSLCIKRLPVVISSLCILIALSFIYIAAIVLPSVLKSSIQDELKMVPDTYEYWGQSPGKTNSVTQRNFTFFNFTNPRDFLYHNKTPILREISGFLLQQRFNYTDYKYSEDNSEVFYNDWLFFTELKGSKNLDQPLQVLNIAPLGFWYQLDKVGLPTFALQGFGGLYVELSQTFKTQAIGQGVSSQFLPNYTNWRAVCDNNQIPQIQCNNTWYDPQHGLSDQNNFEIWVQFGFLNQNDAQNYLKMYFGFTDLQMQSLEQIFLTWSDTLNQILNNWFCDSKECTNNDLTLIQLSSGEITSNPPSGDKVDSICDTGNVTCIGQPEISKYLRNEFKKLHPEQKYQGLKFSTQTFRKLFTSYTGTLLNIGRLTLLFQTGAMLDSSDGLDDKLKYLSQIKEQTYAQSLDHAFVIWQWVKYFTSEFVIKSSKGGSQKNSGIGGVFSQALYQGFTDFGAWITQEYINVLGAEQIPNCEIFVKEIIDNISEQKVKSICSVLNPIRSGYAQLFQPCMTTLQMKQKYRLKHQLSITQFAQYCDSEKNSFYTMAMAIHKKIFDHYGCSVKKGQQICSQYELSMKQFISSAITINPIQNTIKKYNPSLSAKSWNQKLSEYEYKHFLKEVFGDQGVDKQVFTEKQLIDMLSFDKLFSASMVMELMLEHNQINFEKLYYWKNMTLLKTYIKFITVEVGLGGFTQKRSPRELLFGYEDPFLKTLQETDTMMGGDPSINPIIMLNEPNITLQQASLFPQSVYTGQSNISLTRQYSSIFGKKYVTYNKTWFDGYQIQSQFVSPYRKQVPVKGSDAIQSPPGLDQKSLIYCFIANIYRIAQLDFKEHTQMYDIDLLSFTASKYFLASERQYAPNHVYYQQFNGFHNISFLGVPLHISKNNFYECPKNWSELVTVYDEQGVYQIEGSIQDDTVLKVQPNTGALFFATVRLQTNYHFEADALFSPSSRMLPVNNVIRQGQIDQSTADQLFGDLKMALGLKNGLLITASIIIPLSFIVIAFSCYRQSKENEKRKKIEQSLISIEQQSIINVQKSGQHLSDSNEKEIFDPFVSGQKHAQLRENLLLKNEDNDQDNSSVENGHKNQVQNSERISNTNSRKYVAIQQVQLIKGQNKNSLVNINQTIVNESVAQSSEA